MDEAYDGSRNHPTARDLPPFPFIVGCGRSGTTLLRSLLDSHPDVAVPGESYFIVELARQHSKWTQPEGFAWAPFLEAVLSHPRVRPWGLVPATVVDAFREENPSEYAGAVRLLFACYARQQGKSRFGDKTPIYVTSLPLLAELFPDARFVHVIRDGRDVALALLEVPWGPSNVAAAAWLWREQVLAGWRFGQANPERYLEIRYEELVADSERELRRLCAFVNLSFSPAMLDHGASVARFLEMDVVPQSHARLHLPPSAGLRDWTTQMVPRDVDEFEVVAGDALGALAYPRTNRPPLTAVMRARFRQAAASTETRARRLHARLAPR